MNDLLDSIRAQIYTRLSSPLFGAFVVSWICWNHWYLFILFSDLPAGERFALAKALVYPEANDVWLRGLAWPLLTSVGFILVYPFPSRWLFKYWHKREVETKKLRDEIEANTVLTLEESRKVTIDAVKLKERYQETIEAQLREIDALRTELREKSAVHSENDPVPAEIVRLRSVIGELQTQIKNSESQATTRDALELIPEPYRYGVFKLIETIAHASGQKMTIGEVKRSTNLADVEAQYLIDRALETGLVEMEGVVHIRLTKKGRSYYVEITARQKADGSYQPSKK